MDIISHYSAYTPAKTSATGQTGTKALGVNCMSAGAFLKSVREQGTKAPDKSSFLYNGSTTRAQLSDTEIAVLANKYDPHNMDQETYDAFLDDLQSMGAISDIEKRQMGYNGFQLIGYMDGDGSYVPCGSTSAVWRLPEEYDTSECLIAPWEADTDILKWLEDRTGKELVATFDPNSWEQAKGYEDLLKGVLKVLGRMEARQEEDAEKAEKQELVRQLADGNSDFYVNMRTQLKAQVKKNDEDREEQAIIDAMAAVLDAMSGKETVAGEKISVNKSASDLTKKIGEKISRLRKEDPENPEIVKLENMLKRLQEMGIYFDLSDTDDLWQDDEENFETLTQLLIRRQAEESAHPNEEEVNEPA